MIASPWLKHVQQILHAKLMISPDITFVLLIFLAECVRFLTYLGEVTYHLFKIRSRLKEKIMDSCVVGLGLSLDVLIYNKV